jgi:hypothetical protein
MKLNKSPGLDGLTVEFYRAFWGKLKIVLTDIQLMKDSLNPKCLRVFSMKFHSKESKAFVKSTKIIAPSILYMSA